MKLVPTRRSDYGIRAMLYLARHDGNRVKSSEIAEAMDLPKDFLHQVLQGLQRTGYVNSRPGRTGGYQIARPPEAVSLLDVIEAVDGPLDPGECALNGFPCHWVEVCAVHTVWTEARDALRGKLDSASLAELAEIDAAIDAGTYEVPDDAHRRGSDGK